MTRPVGTGPRLQPASSVSGACPTRTVSAGHRGEQRDAAARQQADVGSNKNADRPGVAALSQPGCVHGLCKGDAEDHAEAARRPSTPFATPRRSAGTAPRTALEFGAVNSPMPRPVSNRAITSRDRRRPLLPRQEKEARRYKSKPSVAGVRVPMRSDNPPLTDALIAITMGWHVSSRPACAGLSPCP